MGYIFISMVFMFIGMFVSNRLKSKFREYGEIPLSAGLSGREVAERMLNENGIHDVDVTSSKGFLSDHYNPTDKTVNLSPDVYDGRSVSAAAVAAHECGHAIQHATAYSMLQLRSKLVPIVKISSSLAQWVIFAGLGLFFGRGNQMILLIGIILFSVTTIFSLITLPVEYDASNRALAWISERRVFDRNEHAMAKDALWWAAMTYVVAALGSLATLLYYVSLLTGRD